jgi:hypothetical protein
LIERWQQAARQQSADAQAEAENEPTYETE